MDLWAIFFRTQKSWVNFSRLCQKLVIIVWLIPPKINAKEKENCENVNALSRKLHFCKTCYILGKAIAGTAKIFPSIVILLSGPWWKDWAISNNGFRSDSLYEKKIGEDLVFNNALPKSLTIAEVGCLKAKPKLHNSMVYRQFIMIPVVLIDATNYVYKCITT